MAELLLELFSEEIPARMQVPAANMLREITEARFKEEQVYARSIKTFVTPRR
ncbi:MAG: glycine--tRNA ligase subunit beta, partial [Proteobacteria bacterium]|nr:glycine--tRNA ligase subunit beta [Pseudomonadota bacterium]